MSSADMVLHHLSSFPGMVVPQKKGCWDHSFQRVGTCDRHNVRNVSRAGNVVRSTLVGGLLIVLPVYLAVALLLKALKTVGGLLAPVTALLPDWVPFKDLWSVLSVIVFCFVIGAVARTRTGRRIRERVESSLFGDLPGYSLFRSLTRQLAGQGGETEWKPALAEIEDALVPAFIVDYLDDGRLSVFVPSVPTPFAGAVYVLPPDRVHAVDVPFTHALKVVSRWGSGAGELTHAMDKSS